MNIAIVLLAAGIFFLMTRSRWVVRRAPKGIDWALEVAFVRLDFPAEQRAVAQRIAGGLAEVVGMKIKQLKPEHDLSQIAAWSDDHIHARDLITLFVIAFDVQCDPTTTFRALVEKVAQKKADGSGGKGEP